MDRARATDVVAKLREAGYEAYFAGGCVRDRLLGIEPRDYDVATAASPDTVEDLFADTRAVGRRFAVVLVRSGEDWIEVATFRKDGPYGDGRRPDRVDFTDAKTDAARRDFTINALFEDPVDGRIVDFTGGEQDLRAGVVRAVGDPERRFEEDSLRLLRAPRFAARLGFEIEPATLAAIRANAASIGRVAPERIGEEIVRMLTEGDARKGVELLDACGLLEPVLPEVAAMAGCEQSPDNHPEGDVFEHTLRCLAALPPRPTETLALGVLLHDVAKPATAATTDDGRRTFYGHTGLGAEMAVEICRRLRRSGQTTERVEFLVAQHLRHGDAPKMKPATLKRFLRQDGIDELLELARIDALGSRGDLSLYEFCRDALANLPADQIRPDPLVRGGDLIALGLEPGPRFKEILAAVEDAQLDGSVRSREDALRLVHALATE